MRDGFYHSKLFKKQEKRKFRLAAFLIFFSLFIILVVIFFGPFLLVKISLFLGEIRNSSVAPQSEDKIPPPPPEIIIPFEATSSSKISFLGFAEPGTKVEIFVNDLSQKSGITDNDGKFNINNLEISQGENEIYAVAIDNAGNLSQSSPKTMVIFDNTPPKLEISQPENKATFYGLSKTIEIKGETEEDTTVSINDHLATMEAGGKFRYSLTLSRGENRFKIIATDKAGNESEKEITVFLE